MRQEYNTIIIGGGVVGNGIAYHLSEHKKEGILVIDKNYPLSGTSGSTQAWIWLHTKAPGWYAEFSMYSAELYSFLEKKIGDFEFRRSGGLSPIFTEEGLEKAKQLIETQAEAGLKVKLLSREEALSIEPFLSPKIKGATYCKSDGNINPFRLVEMYMRSSKANGVDYSFRNRVSHIQKEKGSYILETEKGTVKTKNLVVATGIWSKEIGEMLGIHIPVRPVRGQILVTEPLAPILKSTLSGLRQTMNGEILIGYSQEEVGIDRRGTMDIIQATAQMAIKYVPKLKTANIVRSFSGLRVMPEDGFPILGKVPNLENVYVAVMHSGVTLSPLVGTLMTELILEGETSLPIDQYSITRFQER